MYFGFWYSIYRKREIKPLPGEKFFRRWKMKKIIEFLKRERLFHHSPFPCLSFPEERINGGEWMIHSSPVEPNFWVWLSPLDYYGGHDFWWGYWSEDQGSHKKIFYLLGSGRYVPDTGKVLVVGTVL